LETRRDGDKPLPLDCVGAGQLVVAASPYHWHFSARALEATKAVFFYGSWLRKQCEQDSVFGFEMVKRMATVVVRRLEMTQQYIRHPSPLPQSLRLSW